MGKDPTKVDRSAAYICRQMAKSVVKGGLAKRCLVQLSYAIGVAKPLSLFVETYGTENGHLTPDDITNVLKIEFDCRPGAIAQSLALRERHQALRVGECEELEQVCTHDFRASWCSTCIFKFPHQICGLSLFGVLFCCLDPPLRCAERSDLFVVSLMQHQRGF